MSKQKENKLSACPFCGGEAEFVGRGIWNEPNYIKCKKCEARSPAIYAVNQEESWRRFKPDAIQAWNTRTPNQDNIADGWEERFEQKFFVKNGDMTPETYLDVLDFIRSLNKKSELNQDCIEFTGPDGGCNKYGVLSLHGKPYSAHRVAFKLANPHTDLRGKVICHSCDNPICINPKHLFAGKPIDNVKDMVSKNRNAKGENHGRAKLKNKDIPVIIERLSKGHKLTHIAKDYGVHRAVISRIRDNKSWKSVQ